ncbi:MAG: DEAD/DEAH box helicase [Saprospiraceae bacterium]|nr:DEAD/DEAH box helicase [Saprospiraceae bacterium]MBK8451306.1 DEAD/DEAH box helicase [Saprospiraceae bacterium]MBK9220774.1 DEAD/DEAH box helicase [Saprospiraceae bacterium]MBK9722381.1 DEAD/DEAH box helicase [Saprospiraceae bacterium]MBK9729405.1 DEAD/DEAH box helicase [Saprospiraceae bacterium]
METISRPRKTSQRHFSTRPSESTRFAKKRKPLPKELDSSNFIKKAIPLEESKYEATRTIKDLPVDAAIITNLLKKGYEFPTEIQDRSIEAIQAGRDFLGLAKTGTGKTAAFLIPIVHALLDQKPAFQVLIISPTRELAMQIEQEYRSLTTGLKLFSTCLIGGTSVDKDIQRLKRPTHLIIGTPGRITDMVRQRSLDLSCFSVLVLDEFDRLLDMGFSNDIQKLVGGMKNRKQTILFSATEEKGQRQLIDRLLRNPVEVKLNIGNASGDHIEQEIIQIKQGETKMEVLLKMVRDTSFEKVLVFAETKQWVKKVCHNLRHAGIKADEIHGNKSQNYRIKALESFKNQKIQVLVATDVAARGLDIVDVSHVINFQQPKNLDSYIHRIGRTGRAGKSGKAYTFVN